MGIRDERSRRNDTRYNWEYFEDDHGLDCFHYFVSRLLILLYSLLYFIELFIFRKEMRLLNEKEWKR